MWEEFNFKLADFIHAVHIDFLGNKTLFIEDYAPEILDLLRCSGLDFIFDFNSFRRIEAIF